MLQPPVLLKFLAVVRHHYDDGGASNPETVEPAQELGQLTVPVAEPALIERL